MARDLSGTPADRYCFLSAYIANRLSSLPNLDGLDALSNVVNILKYELPELKYCLIDMLRDGGHTWEEIAEELGVKKQTANYQHLHPSPTAEKITFPERLSWDSSWTEHVQGSYESATQYREQGFSKTRTMASRNCRKQRY